MKVKSSGVAFIFIFVSVGILSIGWLSQLYVYLFDLLHFQCIMVDRCPDGSLIGTTFVPLDLTLGSSYHWDSSMIYLVGVVYVSWFQYGFILD